MYGIWLAFAAAGFRICAKGTWPLFILSFHSKNCTLSVTFHNGLSVRYLRIASVNSGIVPLPFSSISGFLHSLLGILRMCWLVSPSPHSLIRGNLLIIWLPFWYHYLLCGTSLLTIISFWIYSSHPYTKLWHPMNLLNRAIITQTISP